ncbi:MAG: YqjK family protein [Sideroxydans sp.]|nr:YqjK family protein [Sideroxydans sp.]
MNKRLLEIRLRRAELQNLIAEQRGQIAEFGERWQGVFRLADKGLVVLRFLRHQPLLSGMLTALLVRRRREAWKLARTSFGLWKGLGIFRSLANRWLPAGESTQR